MSNRQKRKLVTFAFCILAAIGIRIALNWDDIKEPKYNVDPELENYLTSFVNLADLKGIDLSYIYAQDIYIKFTDKEKDNRVATAFKRGYDGIAIIVDKEKFMARTEEGRKYVMFHEFGHDILDFPHLEGNERGMMEPTAYTGFFRSYERFSQERQEKYLYTSLNKMFNRFKDKQ